ncbi:MAG TPA: molybdenum cofactor guanylyltransferase [Vicinamibacterales bacterium]|jgi:molybdopterin-guanine dinucleotide biosynthesis protein A|nr:molybdenum cofactor guanylyltransferase [Vicinamibacterales bacterium]
MWTGAILAGGRSRRLGGRNKAALKIGDATVLDRQLARLRGVVDRTIIVAGDAAPFAWTGLPVIPDLRPGDGALGALRTAVHAAQTDRTLVMACDMPFVTEALLGYLVDAGRAADIAIPRTRRGYEPLCATYSRRCADEMARLIAERRFKLSEVALIPGLIIRELGPDELRPFGPEELLFFNINTSDDYARAIDLDANS